MADVELEKRLVIWDNRNGESIELGDNSDGLDGLHELRYRLPEGKVQSTINFTDEQLKLLKVAIDERLKGFES